MQNVNQMCPVEQRIQEGLVVITGSMPRMAKWYPRRKMVYGLSEKDVDGLYRREEMRMKALKNSTLTEEAKAEVGTMHKMSRIGMRV